MKKGKRLYINITNRCNTDCPFCCMYSGTANHIDMDFNTYKQIIDDCPEQFELQLEGGEPLLHPGLYLFMEYAASTGRCRKIIVLTNGLILNEHIKHIISFSEFHGLMCEIKISINYWLIKEHPGHIEEIENYIFATEFINAISIICNVRLRDYGDETIRDRIEQSKLLKDHSNIFYLQSYGRLSGSKYEKPVIVQNIESWELYAVDGTSFGNDLIKRSEYEKELQDEHIENYQDQ